MNISQVILMPVLTEKSARAELVQKYTFVVNQDATKIDVKNAIEQMFKAKVADVNIKKGLPKYKIGKGRKPMQKRATTRQAIVTLRPGEKLDISKLSIKSNKTE